MGEAVAELGRELLDEAKAGNKERVMALLERGVVVDFMDDQLNTALMMGSRRGFLDVCKVLVSKGANINHVNANYSSALLLASVNDHLPVCLFLLSLGADPAEENSYQRTALSHYGCDKTPPPPPPVLASRLAAFKEAREAYLRNEQMTAAREATLHSKIEELQRPVRANASLLFAQTYSDLVFVCPGGERIHAHRNIVAASSPCLRKLLLQQAAESREAAAEGHDTTISVSEVAMLQSAPAVRALLRFMYTGEVDAKTCLSHSWDILDLAVQHEQPHLKAACEASFGETISVQSVGPVLETAHKRNLTALKATCLDFMLNNMAVFFCKSFTQIEAAQPGLWRELRAAVGAAAEEEEDEEQDEQEEDKDEEDEGTEEEEEGQAAGVGKNPADSGPRN